MGLAERASAIGTQAFQSRFPSATFRSLDGLQLSSLGWSTSRRPGHETALTILNVLERGINVFDIVPHCRGGAVESAVSEAIASRSVAREELVLMTRAGFLPDPVQNFGLHREAIERKYISRGVFQWDDLAFGTHCLAPAFLRHSVQESLGRLGTGIDILLLASPAAQLAIAPMELLERRLRAAFEELEHAVAEGRIHCYGIANPAELSLERTVQLAREIAGDRHHFKVVQFPLSLHTAAATLSVPQRVDGRECNLVDAARALGLYVVLSEVINGGAAEYDLDPSALRQLGAVASDVQIALQWARSLTGVGTALCGMRRAVHIDENSRVGLLPPADPDFVAAFVPELAAS